MLPNTKQQKLIKSLSEYVPLIGFFTVYWLCGLNWATGILVVLTVIATIISRVMLGKLPMIPLLTAVLVVFFGGLTLIFDDERFIKMKPTVVQVALALILMVSAYIQRPLIATMMGQQLKMPLRHWQILSYRFAIFFLVMAGLNEYIWRNFSTDFWVNFKFFGLTGLTFIFSLFQVFFIMKNAEELTENSSTNNHD